MPILNLPEVGSTRFSSLVSLEELELALDECKHSCPGLDGLIFFLVKIADGGKVMSAGYVCRHIGDGSGATDLVSDKSHANCEARQGFLLSISYKAISLWQEAHGYNDMYTFGLLDRKERTQD
jgi:hypothetical protein